MAAPQIDFRRVQRAVDPSAEGLIAETGRNTRANAAFQYQGRAEMGRAIGQGIGSAGQSIGQGIADRPINQLRQQELEGMTARKTLAAGLKEMTPKEIVEGKTGAPLGDMEPYTQRMIEGLFKGVRYDDLPQEAQSRALLHMENISNQKDLYSTIPSAERESLIAQGGPSARQYVGRDPEDVFSDFEQEYRQAVANDPIIRAHMSDLWAGQEKQRRWNQQGEWGLSYAYEHYDGDKGKMMVVETANNALKMNPMVLGPDGGVQNLMDRVLSGEQLSPKEAAGLLGTSQQYVHSALKGKNGVITTWAEFQNSYVKNLTGRDRLLADMQIGQKPARVLRNMEQLKYGGQLYDSLLGSGPYKVTSNLGDVDKLANYLRGAEKKYGATAVRDAFAMNVANLGDLRGMLGKTDDQKLQQAFDSKFLKEGLPSMLPGDLEADGYRILQADESGRLFNEKVWLPNVDTSDPVYMDGPLSWMKANPAELADAFNVIGRGYREHPAAVQMMNALQQSGLSGGDLDSTYAEAMHKLVPAIGDVRRAVEADGKKWSGATRDAAIEITSRQVAQHFLSNRRSKEDEAIAITDEEMVKLATDPTTLQSSVDGLLQAKPEYREGTWEIQHPQRQDAKIFINKGKVTGVSLGDEVRSVSGPELATDQSRAGSMSLARQMYSDYAAEITGGGQYDSYFERLSQWGVPPTLMNMMVMEEGGKPVYKWMEEGLKGSGSPAQAATNLVNLLDRAAKSQGLSGAAEAYTLIAQAGAAGTQDPVIRALPGVLEERWSAFKAAQDLLNMHKTMQQYQDAQSKVWTDPSNPWDTVDGFKPDPTAFAPKDWANALPETKSFADPGDPAARAAEGVLEGVKAAVGVGASGAEAIYDTGKMVGKKMQPGERTPEDKARDERNKKERDMGVIPNFVGSLGY